MIMYRAKRKTLVGSLSVDLRCADTALYCCGESVGAMHSTNAIDGLYNAKWLLRRKCAEEARRSKRDIGCPRLVNDENCIKLVAVLAHSRRGCGKQLAEHAPSLAGANPGIPP